MKATTASGGPLIDPYDYQALAEFRYQIRRFLRFSEEAARAAGLEPQQHQLLLAVKGLPMDARASIGEIAERLQIQHHSAVELVDRLTSNGLVQRKRRPEDRREVLISLTPKGELILRDLSVHHRAELQSYLPSLIAALKRLAPKPGRRTSKLRSRANAKSRTARRRT